MFYVRSGALFNIKNIGNEKALILLYLRHKSPKDFTMSSLSGAFTDTVLRNTFDVDASVFKKAERSINPKVFLRREGELTVPRSA